MSHPAPDPETSALPRRADSVRARRLGDDVLLMHTGLKQYHVLNDVAGRIFELADGSRSIAAIADELAAIYDAERADLLRDVRDTVLGLEALRVIELRPKA